MLQRRHVFVTAPLLLLLICAFCGEARRRRRLIRRSRLCGRGRIGRVHRQITADIGLGIGIAGVGFELPLKATFGRFGEYRRGRLFLAILHSIHSRFSIAQVAGQFDVIKRQFATSAATLPRSPYFTRLLQPPCQSLAGFGIRGIGSRKTSGGAPTFRKPSRFDRQCRQFCQRAGGGFRRLAFGT